MLIGSSPRRAAIVGGLRIPFARAMGSYAEYGNQDMLSGVQSAVIEDQVVDWIVEHGGVDVTEQKTTFSELVEESKRSQG